MERTLASSGRLYRGVGFGVGVEVGVDVGVGVGEFSGVGDDSNSGVLVTDGEAVAVIGSTELSKGLVGVRVAEISGVAESDATGVIELVAVLVDDSSRGVARVLVAAIVGSDAETVSPLTLRAKMPTAATTSPNTGAIKCFMC
jgi:hypothetical protein